jgi:hypothetical protein
MFVEGITNCSCGEIPPKLQKLNPRSFLSGEMLLCLRLFAHKSTHRAIFATEGTRTLQEGTYCRYLLNSRPVGYIGRYIQLIINSVFT